MPRETFQNFSLKFIDIIVGIVLGLGFQWWPDLREPWQYIAFVFVYINLIDYWIDYSPTLKKYPPRHELDLMIHIFIAFTMFLLVYSTRGSMTGFLLTYMVYRVGDIVWTLNMRNDYKPPPAEAIFINTWLRSDIIETVGAAVLFFAVGALGFISPLIAMALFVALRVSVRIFASLRYGKVFFA